MTCGRIYRQSAGSSARQRYTSGDNVIQQCSLSHIGSHPYLVTFGDVSTGLFITGRLTKNAKMTIATCHVSLFGRWPHPSPLWRRPPPTEMLSIATRAALQPTKTTLARSLAIRAASIYTLPELPYAYNVQSLMFHHFLFIFTRKSLVYRLSNHTSPKR